MGARHRLRLVEPDRFDPHARARLERVFDIQEGACSAAELTDVFGKVDVVWLRLGHRISRENLPKDARCRFIVTPVTGLDHIDLEWCESIGVRILSLRGETEFLREVRATAEHTIGLALALYRHIPAAVADVRSGNWQRDPFQGRELYGKVAGIVGVGRLGSQVAEYCRCFGMRVVGFDPYATLPAHVQPMPTLAALFAESDVISLHIPLSAETHHLIDAAVLANARPHTILINTSRGAVLDQTALLDALENRALGGAALDVIEGEPDLPFKHPLLAYARKHENLLITPHIGGNTAEAFSKTERFLADRLLEVFRG